MSNSPHHPIHHSSSDYPALTGREVSRNALLTQLLEAWRTGPYRVMGLYGRAGMGKSIASIQTVAAVRASGLTLTHALWLELRTCPDAGGILSQLADCFNDIGQSELVRQLRQEAQPAPQLLAHALVQALGKDCLLIVDQCEAVLDKNGQVGNPYLRELLVALLGQTGWRGLVTVRTSHAEEIPSKTLLVGDDAGTKPFLIQWFMVDELSRDERTTMLRLALPHSPLRWNTLNTDHQRFILDEVAGHPYAFNLFLADPSDELATVVTEIRNRIANRADEYEVVDYYVGQVSTMARPMLELLASLDDREPWPFLEGAWHVLGSNLGWPTRQAGAALSELLRRALVEEGPGGYRILPILRHYLSHRSQQFGLSENLAKLFHYHLALLYDVLAKQVKNQAQILLATKDDPNAFQRATELVGYYAVLRDRALRQALSRGSLRLVRRALEGLLEPVSWQLTSRFNAGRCFAYTQRLTALVEQVLAGQDEDAQPAEVGACYHMIGRVCEEIQILEQALTVYQSALAWWERTRQPHRMGDTWIRIGMVLTRRHQWIEALTAYRTALDWWERTRQHSRMGYTWYRIGRLYADQNSWEDALSAYQTALDWQIRTRRQGELGNTWQRIGEAQEVLGQLGAAALAYAQTLELLPDHHINIKSKSVLASAQQLLASAPPRIDGELERLREAINSFLTREAITKC